MVIPEKVTPSGVVLNERKLHGGLGFEKMFDCFVYDGLDEKTTHDKYFLKPEKLDDSLFKLVDCDKFRLFSVDVDGKYSLENTSYCIAVVTDGNVTVNGEKYCPGDRMFISETEEKLIFDGKGKVLLCRP